jgi:NAD(P)-dependent dehydrogenase (short-subunit alcohol dehydrogenase family)
MKMSAYVIVEATVRDTEARERYSSQVGPILRKFGGEVLAAGPWLSLFGEPAPGPPLRSWRISPSIRRERFSAGRIAEAEEVVGAAILLASPAGAYISGQVLLIDGARSVT